MEVTIDHKNKVLLVDANQFRAGDGLKLFAAIHEVDPEKSFDVLIDRSAPATGLLSWTSIREGAFASVAEAKKVMSGRRVASVVQPGARYAVARQIAALASSLDVTVYRPFTSTEEAMGWLRSEDAT